MSHNTEDTIVCPNCGFPATRNYCAQCGQETHLYKESFGGLILHFIEHYFHYDSKFWNTLKALWFSPGKLTTAYWNKQRARYIPPMSLYIFISAVYFLVYFLTAKDVAPPQSNIKLENQVKTYPLINKINISEKDSLSKLTIKLKSFLSDPEAYKTTGEKIKHNVPKLCFFLIPFIALIIWLFFSDRKNLNFTDHTIFALHISTFFFAIKLFSRINPFHGISDWVENITTFILLIYFTIALKNVYKITWVRSLFYSISISALSFFSFFCILIIYGFAYIYFS